MSKSAICLLSGGLDSTTALYVAKSEGYDLTALTVDYGQRHTREREFAEKTCQKLGIELLTFNMNLGDFGGSALTDKGIDVPKGRDMDEMTKDIPVTYVPGRNLLMLSMAREQAIDSMSRLRPGT